MLNRKEAGNSDPVDEILRQPKSSLEARIADLDSRIQKRETLRDKALSRLLTSRSRAQEQLYRHRYEELSSPSSGIFSNLKRRLEELDRTLELEEAATWSDIQPLLDAQQQAVEELESERLRLRLLSESREEDDD